jgi:hydroxyacylglutathione hydrolase
VIDLGAFQIRVMTTPGHTPEHISFLLVEPDGKTPTALFSGGALIVGGAARTDLFSSDLTRPLATQLYHTIHDRLLKLPDEVDVFPTHGAGSYCVAPTSPDRTTTIGRERRSNALAQPQSEEEFIKRALSGLPSYPSYYKYMRELNQKGARILGGVPLLKPYSPAEVRALMEDGVVVIDIRHQKQFGAGHIPNSYGIRVDSPLVVWAGWVIPFGSRIILLSESAEQREDATRQLIRIGYDDVLGYIEGGIEAWAKAFPVETVHSIHPKELRERLNDMTLVDVRQRSEWEQGHIPGAIHFEGGRIAWEELPFPLDKPLVIQCASGNRSMVAISVLKRRGVRNVLQVDGGINKWKMNGFEVVTYHSIKAENLISGSLTEQNG